MSLRVAIVAAVAFFLISVPVLGQSDIGFKGIGAKIGYLKPEDIDGTFTVGAVVDLGTFIPELHWDASIQYWSASNDELDYDWSWTDVAIKSTVRYLFPTGGNVAPYAGGGLGIHFYSWEHDGPVGSYSDSDSEFGFHILGGVEFPLAPQWKVQVEAEYASADLDQIAVVANFIYALGR
jgi:hypothetical protein